MMKWLRALLLKDDLTSLQNHDQNISEICITIMMMFLVRLITICPLLTLQYTLSFGFATK